MPGRAQFWLNSLTLHEPLQLNKGQLIARESSWTMWVGSGALP